MEENKAKMELKTTSKSEKMSYEELENVAHQLSEQSKQLYQKLIEANTSNMFKRLDYLFKVVENDFKFSDDFASRCIKEIEDIMTLPEEEEPEKE